MNMNKLKRSIQSAVGIACLLMIFFANPTMAGEYLVKSQTEYGEAVKAAQPGDTILLANGEWRNFEILFTGKGTEEQPITLTAETKGQVLITGRSNLRLGGEYLVVSGLVFKDGHAPGSPVIAFRASEEDLAFHSRVTEVVIDGFFKPERTYQDSWVTLSGKHNRLDHSFFAGKSNRGVTIGVQLHNRDGSGMVNIENHHRIDHNYFGPRPVIGSNGGETMRLGNSWNSLSDSLTTVENNFFDRCDGEVEIISNKSGGNVFRGNVFFESRGTLTLRHGNGNLIENNVFIGNRVPHTGGIRVINKQQTVRNNYMQGLTGHRLGGGFVIMNGVYNSVINRYHQVDGALIENNSIIDADNIEFGAGSDEERQAVPINSVFRKNLIFNADGRNSITEHDDMSGIAFTDNSINQDIKLEKAANGLLYPTDPALADVGASRDLVVLDRADTGPSWYPKPGNEARFGGGKTHDVESGLNTLADAIGNAGPGDIFELGAGEHIASRIIAVDTPVTVRGNAEALIRFERTALFEIVEGGSLKLDGVTISGSNAPRRVPGSSVVRTTTGSVVTNFDLVVENSTIENLNSSPSFSFFSAGKYTFADNIQIRNTSFTNVSGTVLLLNREIDDGGNYNVEFVTITDSRFENVGAVADIYRGGRDESTFGPYFAMSSSQVVTSTDRDEDNTTGASIRLFGVQNVNIHGNEFVGTKRVQILETVGDPVTKLANNRFTETPEPEIRSGLDD